MTERRDDDAAPAQVARLHRKVPLFDDTGRLARAAACLSRCRDPWAAYAELLGVLAQRLLQDAAEKEEREAARRARTEQRVRMPDLAKLHATHHVTHRVRDAMRAALDERTQVVLLLRHWYGLQWSAIGEQVPSLRHGTPVTGATAREIGFRGVRTLREYFKEKTVGWPTAQELVTASRTELCLLHLVRYQKVPADEARLVAEWMRDYTHGHRSTT